MNKKRVFFYVTSRLLEVGMRVVVQTVGKILDFNVKITVFTKCDEVIGTKRPIPKTIMRFLPFCSLRTVHTYFNGICR